MKIEKIKILILLFFLLLSGCAMEGLNTAEVLEPGEMSIGIGEHCFPVEKLSDDFKIEYLLEHSYLSFRRGFVLKETNSDFGIRAYYYPGLVIDVRHQLLKEPVALALGMGVGTIIYLPCFEIAGYLSKRYGFITPYLVCKGVPGVDFVLFALGTQLSLCSTVDLLCEIDLLVPYLEGPLGSFMFNFHSPREKQEGEE